MSLKKKITTAVLSTTFVFSLITAAQAAPVTSTANETTRTVAATAAVTSVEILTDEITTEVNIGTKFTLQATAMAEGDVEYKGAKTWKSSNAKVLKVDNKGNVIAVGAGTASITATAGGVTSDPVDFTVHDQNAVAELSIEYDGNGILAAGESVPLKVNATNADGDPVNLSKKKAIWKSSDPKVLAVDNKGKVTAKALGQATITVSIDDKTAEKEFEVKDTSTITTLEISAPEEVNPTGVKIGDFFILGVKAENADGDSVNLAKKKLIFKSSDPKVAIVDAKGKVTAKGLGTAKITLTIDKTTSDPLEVTVKDATAIEELNIKLPEGYGEDSPTILSKGDKVSLTPIALDADGETVSLGKKKVTWESSNKNTATVDGKGNVVAKALGEVTITLKIDNKTATHDFSIKDKNAIETVEIPFEDSTELDLQTPPFLLVPAAYDAEGDQVGIVSKKVVWASNSPKVLAVDQKGRVTVKGEGEATITVTIDGKTAELTFTVGTLSEDPEPVEEPIEE